MNVFVTGATGFIGSAVVRELLTNGHQVLGLARSDVAADSLKAIGASVHRGTLEHLDSLRSGAAATDGVIHTAFIHNFAEYARAADIDRLAIETLGEVLAGSDRPLVVSTGLAGLGRDRALTEDDGKDNPSSRGGRVSEEAALALASRGVRVSVVRLPPTVHGEGDRGFVPALISIARTKGQSAYPGDGSNRWSAVHRLDAARLYRLALETAAAGTRLHAIADEGIPLRDIASAIGRRLDIPVVGMPVERVREHFDWLAPFITLNCPASSAITQQRFGWHPVQPTLLNDLDQDFYFS